MHTIDSLPALLERCKQYVESGDAESAKGGVVVHFDYTKTMDEFYKQLPKEYHKYFMAFQHGDNL